MKKGLIILSVLLSMSASACNNSNKDDKLIETTTEKVTEMTTKETTEATTKVVEIFSDEAETIARKYLESNAESIVLKWQSGFLKHNGGTINSIEAFKIASATVEDWEDYYYVTLKGNFYGCDEYGRVTEQYYYKAHVKVNKDGTVRDFSDNMYASWAYGDSQLEGD